MSIMLKGHELFKFEEITKKVDRVKTQLDEVNSNISSYENKIAVLDTEIQELFAMMVMEDNIAEEQKSIADRKARKNNYEEQLKIQYGLKSQLEAVLKEKLPELLQRAEAERKEDMQTYLSEIQRPIYQQLAELRTQQEYLLGILEASHREVNHRCNELGEYKVLNGEQWSGSGATFHTNAFMPAYKDIPSPFFNISSMSTGIQNSWRNHTDNGTYEARKKLPKITEEELNKWIKKNCK